MARSLVLALLLLQATGCPKQPLRPEAPVAGKPDPCRSWFGCETWGLCTTNGKTCVATRASDCRDAWICTEYSACRLAGSRCGRAPGTDGEPLRQTDADCSKTADQYAAPCKGSGLCKAQDGVCVAGSDDDCRRSEACVQNGHCQRMSNLCLPPDGATCERTTVCKEQGECVWQHGFCVATDASCAATPACRDSSSGCKAKHGRCDVAATPFIYFQF